MVEQVACANGKGIKNTSKVRPKSIPKSMNNRYKNHARKRDTQKMEKKRKLIIQKGGDK